MKSLLAICLILSSMAWSITSFASQEKYESTREPLPELKLTVPDNDFYRKYLGLEGKPGEEFSPSDIKADILLIELFSMYCPYCQQEAPLVNELFEKMQKVSKNGVVVKLIGLGASNTQFEVEHFRDTYQVPFPLFPDKDMSMYKALGGAGTPGFIGCRLNGEQGSLIVLRNSGGFYSSDDFLQELIKESNQQ